MPAVHRRAAAPSWPHGLTRVPYWVYQDQAVLDAEQRRCSRDRCGISSAWKPTSPTAGDWRTTSVGRMPVVVVAPKPAPSPRSRTAACIAAR